MASYPDYPQNTSSVWEPVDKVIADESDSGVLRIRKLGTSSTYTGTIMHFLSSADLDALLAFWATNESSEITFVWKGDTSPGNYNVHILNKPRHTFVNGTEWRVEVDMIGKKF